MCGRAYSTYTEDELVARYIHERSKRNPLGLKPNYNLSPTQLAPIVLARESAPSIEMFRFGLVPAWAKSVADASKYSLINAKGEEIETKRSYKTCFERKRCIIPLSGFFEWLRPESGPKRPFAIHLKEEPIMSVAGVWENWKSRETEEELNSFSIITIAANDFMSKIHDRMPVILEKKDEEAWLDPSNNNVLELKKFLRPCPPEWLDSREVSTLVNSPRNNAPECIESLAN